MPVNLLLFGFKLDKAHKGKHIRLGILNSEDGNRLLDGFQNLVLQLGVHSNVQKDSHTRRERETLSPRMILPAGERGRAKKKGRGGAQRRSFFFSFSRPVKSGPLLHLVPKSGSSDL